MPKMQIKSISQHVNPEMCVLTIQTAVGELNIDTHWERLVECLIELATTYDIESVSLASLIGPERCAALPTISVVFPMMEVHWDPVAAEYVAQTKDGDTGVNVIGCGERAADAIADLARNHGFKSNIHAEPGDWRLKQWLIDFNYGMNRISDELLQAELEGITQPEKGSW